MILPGQPDLSLSLLQTVLRMPETGGCCVDVGTGNSAVSPADSPETAATKCRLALLRDKLEVTFRLYPTPG